MDFYRFAEVLSEQRAATKENVERKQARTEFEREDSDDDESEEGKRVNKFFNTKLTKKNYMYVVRNRISF